MLQDQTQAAAFAQAVQHLAALAQAGAGLDVDLPANGVFACTNGSGRIAGTAASESFAAYGLSQAISSPFPAAEARSQGVEVRSQGVESPPAIDREAEARAANIGAHVLRACSASGYLGTVLQPGPDRPYSNLALQAYVTRFLMDCGVSADPIEEALVESFTLVHHAVGKLCGLASDLRNVSGIATVHPAAIKFLGEERRLALTIQAYRASRGAKLHVVTQENAVEGADDEQATAIAKATKVTRPCSPNEICGDTKLTNNRKSPPAEQHRHNGKATAAVA